MSTQFEAVPPPPGGEGSAKCPAEARPYDSGKLLGFSVPLGIGTMMWGNTTLDRRVNGYIIPQEDLESIVRTATKAGVCFFDSAEGYGGGTSERRLCTTFKRLGVPPAGCNKLAVDPAGKKEPLCLATKFLPTLWRATGASLTKALVHSNERLGVECCDLYFIHSPVHYRRLEVWVEAAACAVKEGRIKRLGVSNFNADQVRRAHHEASKHGIRIHANQVMFNLMVFNSQCLREMYDTCRELDIAIIAYAPLGQKLLTDGLTAESIKKIRVARMAGINYDEVQPLRAKVSEIATKHEKTMSQVCVNWVKAKGAVPLVGTRTLSQLQDSIEAVSGDWDLSPKEVAELDELALKKSTLEKPRWRRGIFVVFISLLMVAYRVSSVVV